MATISTSRKVALTAAAMTGVAVMAPATPGGADSGGAQGCLYNFEVYPERVYGGVNAYVDIGCTGGRIGYVQLLHSETQYGTYSVVATSDGFNTPVGTTVHDNAFLVNGPTGYYKAKLVYGDLTNPPHSDITDAPVYIK